MRFRLLVTALFLAVVATGALTSATASADPASVAALPTCTGTKNVIIGGTKATLPAIGNSFDCVLGPGDRGNAVRYLQFSLIFCNNADTGGLDGIYGEKTHATIAWIQAASGLRPVDGIYGPDTRRVIWWFFDNGPCLRSVV